ncbi:uncharacterized protein si:ch211-214j8.12 [Syngnathoides biaculeatus]|uniref:uncharacterized protein si:ch211-214j8.12 n=1 Tax=Syngnathoides biaculeatus TaxID=300417 RepID=UPI002ADDE277|nr:uncharacterized protein si:ch211-214j8.12 [Syngnathoides biaculeatus]XP_061674331.1 uncharacterized protein si:ch211-214j8.12 [Syngnathoides biaculeatus]
MPLFQGSSAHAVKDRPKWRKTLRSRVSEEDDSLASLTQLCLLSLADNMKKVWVKDYADNYMDIYSFRYIMGPFNFLSGELVEELTCLLCSQKKLSRAALHLLLVPQLRGLSLEKFPGLVTPALCAIIAARCQGLHRLNLSGAQQLPSKALSETLRCLPVLRSLSLSGTSCDSGIIRTIVFRCPLLRHLDVSGCHFLPPAALLPLGALLPSSTCSPSSSSSCTSVSPLPLCSLLALDIGFGEEEGDLAAVVAYLLLSLPHLERLAAEGLSQACRLIHRRDFTQVNSFAVREGLPRLEEVWRDRRRMQHTDSWKTRREGAQDGYDSESDDDEEDEKDFSQNVTNEKNGDDRIILRLRDVKGLTCEYLDSFGCLCPNIRSISVNAEDEEDLGGRNLASLLATGLQSWSGQLRSLSVHHQGPLLDLLPALQVSGSSLISLTLEGVRTNRHSPLLELIRACPKLKVLLISAGPPHALLDQEPDERELPSLPNLCSLTLNFSYENNQMRPPMYWMSLVNVVRCLLTGSPLLQRVSLVSLPCPLNNILQRVLRCGDLHPHFGASNTSLPIPLGRVQHLDLQRTDVKMITVKNIIQQSKRLKCVDLSRCWKISYQEWADCKRLSTVKVIWL